MIDQGLIRATTLRELLEGDVPAIAVSFDDSAHAADVDLALADGLDVAELRIDRYSSFAHDHVLETVRRFSALPTIATIRNHDEGGEWRGTAVARAELFRLVLPEVDCIDIELSSMPRHQAVADEARAAGKMLIVSNHNFERTPTMAELKSMANDAKRLGADLVKLSAWTHSHEDLRTLAEFTIENADLGLIVIGMGPHGSASRVFFPALGSKLTYAATTHPVSGQLSYPRTFDMLRAFYPEFNERKVIELEMLDGA